MHPGVAVDVVGVGAAPLQDEVVLALEHRGPGVLVADGPLQPAHGLQREVPERLGRVGVGGGKRRLGDRPSEIVERAEELLPAGEVVVHRAGSSGTEKCRW